MTDHDDTPDNAHDVLAAEEFGMGEADPALHRDSPHDVLAADEFGMGTADPSLHRGPIAVPAEPGAGTRAHDVLAADEFAVPAVPGGPEPAGKGDRTIAVGPRGLAGILAAAALLIAVRRRRRG